MGRLDEAIYSSVIEVIYTFTRSAPSGWVGYARRVVAAMLEEIARPAGEAPLAYVCGPTALVEAVADALRQLGCEPTRIRTGRFGPTGGDR